MKNATLLILVMLGAVALGYVTASDTHAQDAGPAKNTLQCMNGCAYSAEKLKEWDAAPANSYVTITSTPIVVSSGYDPKKIAEIRARLKKITKCPWVSDGQIMPWWSGERPGVIVRSSAMAKCQNKIAGVCTLWGIGAPVAEVGTGEGDGSKHPMADAEFIASACTGIEYLLSKVPQ